MSTTERVSFDRRRLMQAAAAALAIVHAPGWLTAVAQGNPDAVGELVSGNNAFAFDLYQELRGAHETNLLASPYSVSLALAMTWAGARGSTAEQMAEAMRFTLDQADLPAAFGALSEDLSVRGTAEEDEDDQVTARALKIANALWGETSYPFSPDYIGLVAEEFGAALNLVDFRNEPEETRVAINDWVAENTNDRIENIIPEGVITSDTRLVLANAIWFYGAWRYQFEPDRTRDGEFTLLDGSTVSVPFMRQQEDFLYTEGDGFQAIELPYEGSGFAFTVLLPDDGEFEAFEESLDAETFTGIVDALERTDIVLSLPSFEFEFGASLSDALKSLGMTEAFAAGVADFSGMVDGTPPEELFISEVIHKAFIKLDETGTEAAAATVVIMEGAAAAPSEPIEVTVDRPFLFAIRDTETGALLFLGRVLSPES
jgi:serpin B